MKHEEIRETRYWGTYGAFPIGTTVNRVLIKDISDSHVMHIIGHILNHSDSFNVGTLEIFLNEARFRDRNHVFVFTELEQSNEVWQTIIEEIEDLNQEDTKNLPERVLKFNEEFGEFAAELVKYVGITHKPFDQAHLLEEAADSFQCLMSIFIHAFQKTGISMDAFQKEIFKKNHKWREKSKEYTRR